MKKNTKKANISHFAHQYHTKKSNATGAHKNYKKIIPRKAKYKRSYD